MIEDDNGNLLSLEREIEDETIGFIQCSYYKDEST